MISSPNEQLVEDVASVYCGIVGLKAMRGLELDEAGDRTGSAEVILTPRARGVIHKLNLPVPAATIDGVVASLSRPPHPSLVENNRWLHTLLTDGVPVEYKDATTGETRGSRVRLIDFDNPANNDFLVVRQITITATGGKTIRPDLVLYVNGLPLVVIELKDPANTAADLNVAIDQLGRYKTIAPDLFVPNLLLVASDGLLTRVGSITSGRQRFM